MPTASECRGDKMAHNDCVLANYPTAPRQLCTLARILSMCFSEGQGRQGRVGQGEGRQGEVRYPSRPRSTGAGGEGGESSVSSDKGVCI
eukprot:CAMPEP_0174748826 /NCGR_PEP_ID=MMETSP1094-20130205/94370_1 /TAXON_ID=156173 /ORGANISM="Chrysochromulina brevifilum, Strain UTEX LB 985" /LENGTH=88 /DNA_ID=CAMNT_0015953937 /DNA_START=37 /DNA_END=303 /DNA_ORIENTATION=-